MNVEKHKESIDQNLYWGDLHCHTAASYGKGDPQRALAIAAEHLDFCSITGHTSWHDMPEDLAKYDKVISMHLAGFAKLRKYWPEMQQMVAGANRPGEFAALLSCEWHSSKFGDYNIYWNCDTPSLADGENLEELVRALPDRGVILIPHHMGYRQGYRGINWEFFDERVSPLVEIHSSHGTCEADPGPGAYYHSMGPRVAQGTARFGLDLGYRFGFVASTDDHAGFPGNYGNGRVGVFADELTRAGIWDGLVNKRTVAVTGDRIDARIWVEDAFIGQEIAYRGPRHIRAKIEGEDELYLIEVVKNGRVIARRFASECPDRNAGRWKLRLEWGWGQRGEKVEWEGALHFLEGSIRAVHPYFSCITVINPSSSDYNPDKSAANRIIAHDASSCSWSSQTWGNESSKAGTTNCLVLDIEGNMDTCIKLRMNRMECEFKLKELLEDGSKSFYTGGHGSAAVKMHQPVDQGRFHMCFDLVDDSPGRCTDYYYLRVIQRNGQMAWTSPIWTKE